MEPLYIDFTPKQKIKLSKTTERIIFISLMVIIVFACYLLVMDHDKIALFIVMIINCINLTFLTLGIKLNPFNIDGGNFINIDNDGFDKIEGRFRKKQIKWDLVERIEFRQWKVWFYMKDLKCIKINLESILPSTDRVRIKDKIKEYGRLKGIQMSATEIK